MTEEEWAQRELAKLTEEWRREQEARKRGEWFLDWRKIASAETGHLPERLQKDRKDHVLYWQVEAHQVKMKMGLSFLSHLMGSNAVIECMFEIRDEHGLWDMPIMRRPFVIWAGASPSLELLAGPERETAEKELRQLDADAAEAYGMRRVASGPHWYSHRYMVPWRVLKQHTGWDWDIDWDSFPGI